MIDVLVPLADGHRISVLTLRSLCAQTIPCCLLPISREMHDLDSRISQCLARNLARAHARGQFALMMDRSVILQSATTVEQMISYLESHADLDGAAAFRSGYQAHPEPVIACVLYRVASVKRASFRLDEGDKCTCMAINRQLAIRYVPGVEVSEVEVP